MWFLHHCLAYHGSCNPQSWGQLAEFLAVLIVGALMAFGAVIGLLVLLNWISDRL